jgi:hypothetical protein
MKLHAIDAIENAPWGRESLYSVVQRTAEHHSVKMGDLLKEVIWPASGWPESKRRPLVDFRTVAFVAGAGNMAKSWVSVLEKLTGRKDLARFTFLPFANVMRLDGEFRERGARCVVCIREMVEERGLCYDPLVWTLNDYGICSRHHVQQTGTCASCGTDDIVIARSASRVGCCGKCGVWMGGEAFQPSMITDSSRYPLALSAALRDIVNLLDEPRLASVDGTAILEYAATHCFDGNFAEMARAIGMPKNTLSVQLSRRTKPMMGTVATLSVVTGMPIKHLVLGQLSGRRVRRNLLIEPIMRPTPDGKRARRPTMDVDAVRAEVFRVVRGRKTPSLTEVAQQLNVDDRSLRYHFPELAQQIVSKYLTSRKAKSDRRTERNSKLMFNAIVTLVLGHEFPTIRRLGEILGTHLCLEHRDLYFATLESLGLTGKGRAPSPIQENALLAAGEVLIQKNLQFEDVALVGAAESMKTVAYPSSKPRALG